MKITLPIHNLEKHPVSHIDIPPGELGDISSSGTTAVISDIHGNLEALDAVLEDIDSLGVENLVSLGDQVGYGADPERVIQRLIIRNATCLMGNHELALLDDHCLGTFNPGAAQAVRMHRKLLSEESMNFIRTLPRSIVKHGARFVHGLPPGSILEYVSLTPDKKLMRIMAILKQTMSFTGHTHLMMWFELTEILNNPEDISQSRIGSKLSLNNLKRESFNAATSRPLTLRKTRRYLVNSGSVGQPRDGDWRAKYLIWNRDRGIILPRYVPYDNLTAAGKIKKRGLPGHFAEKLLYG
ncbi:MAG: metallophosphoesterase family protein [Desulfamplus sp.]|nr:metallophosphoesterase family protein [Desulfamplus sp.]